MTKWNAQDVIDSLINGQFSQAKEMTIEGLTDTTFEVVSSNIDCQTNRKSELLSVGSEDLKYAFDTLAYRVCDVMEKLAIQGKHSLMANYRKLFE